ncbi:MAG: hypothetical protein A2Z18_04840 [Armatimonadetes bacterium RBG_16_58_9]|nr:MAG: hypothetical protein A2Z18_04840 [Armatimonadetes bacterium RBG_16_58_9]
MSAKGTIKEQPEEAKPLRTPAAEAQPEAPAEEPAAEAAREAPSEAPEEEAAEQEPYEIPLPDVYATLGFTVGMLAEQAWRFMGIRLAPGKKEPEKDLGQAKIAIDTLVFISDKLHPRITDEERSSLRELISNLQINFVQQSK